MKQKVGTRHFGILERQYKTIYVYEKHENVCFKMYHPKTFQTKIFFLDALIANFYKNLNK